MRFGKYEVSETGEVYDTSLELPVEQFMNNEGQMCVRLYMKGKYKVWEIKKLMTEAFNIPHNKGDILVIDGDFNIKNFHYVSRSEYANGILIPNKRKEIVMLTETGEVIFKNYTEAATYIQSVVDTDDDLVSVGIIIKSALDKKRKAYGYRWERR